jgi:hypothetical protein
MTTVNTVAKFEALEAAGVKPNTVAKFEAILEAAGVRLAPLMWAHLEPRGWRDAIGQAASTGKLARNLRGYVGRGYSPFRLHHTQEARVARRRPSSGRIVTRLRLCYATRRQSWPSSRRQWPKMQP